MPFNNPIPMTLTRDFAQHPSPKPSSIYTTPPHSLSQTPPPLPQRSPNRLSPIHPIHPAYRTTNSSIALNTLPTSLSFYAPRPLAVPGEGEWVDGDGVLGRNRLGHSKSVGRSKWKKMRMTARGLGTGLVVLGVGMGLLGEWSWGIVVAPFVLTYNLTEILRNMVTGRGLNPKVHVFMDLVLSAALLTVGIITVLSRRNLDLKTELKWWEDEYQYASPEYEIPYELMREEVERRVKVVVGVGSVWIAAAAVQGLGWAMEVRRLWD